MYQVRKLAIQLTGITLITLSLAACFNGGSTKYRPDPVTVAELDKTKTSLEETEAALDAAVIELGEGFEQQDQGTTVSVKRVLRRSGQLFRFRPGFTPDANGSWSVNTRYDIENQGDPNPNRLRISQDPVLYPRDGTDKKVFFPQMVSTDEFVGRGNVFRTEFLYSGHANYFGNLLATGDTGNQHARPTIQGTDDEDTTKWRNWEAKALSSFQFMPNQGMIMKFGGDESGELIYGDLEAYVAKGCDPATPACNAPNTHDIEITFGQPAHNAYGRDFAYYWSAPVPHPRRDATGEIVPVAGEDPNDPPARRPGALILPNEDNGLNAGNYQLELTYSSDPVITTTSDRYLSYAAYGLFNFVDGYTANKRPGRLQTIHYGLDAFADRDNMRTTDLDDGIEGATFKGRTIAYLIRTVAAGTNRRFASNLVRLRGNIALTANIGPGTDNSISGTIDGMEYYQDSTDSWSRTTLGLNTPGFDFHRALGPGEPGAVGAQLMLQNGTIAADGSFTGDVAPGGQFTRQARAESISPGNPSAYFGTGKFEGNLYGPRDGLETAGTWWIPTRTAQTLDVSGIIGSFGACQDGKGRC